MLTPLSRAQLVVLVVVMGASPLPAQVFVDDDASGAGDGSSWQDALTSLDEALSLPGEIWVAEGTYRSTSQTSFQVQNRNVYGGFDGTETSLAQRAGLYEQTILDGDVLGDDDAGFTNRSDNVARVVVLSGNSARLDGFRVRGGHAPGGKGGGVYIAFGALAEVANCTIESCWAREGGGVYDELLTFTRFENCDFIGNHAEQRGGGLARLGGTAEATPVIGCRFLRNEAQESGGGAWAEWVTFANCSFVANSATTGAGIDSPYGTLVHCTVVGNRASVGAGGAVVSGLVASSIFWRNSSAQDLPGGQAQVDASAVWASIIQNWESTSDQRWAIDADPLFLDPLGPDGTLGTRDDDFRLRADSPAIDAAMDGFQTCCWPPLNPVHDLGGRPREVDSLCCESWPGDKDIGAYELQAVVGTTSYCPATPSSTGVPGLLSGPCVAMLGPVEFTASQLPDGFAAILLGAEDAFTPLGGGTLCVAWPQHSLSVLPVSGGGAMFAVDPSDRHTYGARLGFQVLYRDSGAPGSELNLTNALRCIFTP